MRHLALGHVACLLVAVVASSFAFACSTSTSDCDANPDPAGASAAGPGAIDCGRAGADPTVVDQCTADAFKAKKAFRAHYDLAGIDSQVARVIAGTAAGVVQVFTYDSDPSGGGGYHATLSRMDCVGPHIETTAGHDKIACASAAADVRLCQ